MRCSMCRAFYDLNCINLSSQRFHSFYRLDKKRREAWKCLECSKTKSVEQKKAHRPVASAGQSSNVTLRAKSTPKASTNPTEDNFDASEDESLMDPAIELKHFCEELRAVRTEIGLFRFAMSDLTAAIREHSSRLDGLEGRVAKLEVDNRSDDDVISQLEETIAQLKFEIDERAQEALDNDIDITNYPESDNENPTHIILTVAKKLGVQLDERDVVNARRVGAPRVQTEHGGAASEARPRPIAVRLSRRSHRDALLQAARVRRRLTAYDAATPASSPQSHPFYINERLTRNNRLLFQATRDAAKRMGWKYVWTRDGKIFARQESGKARHRLRSGEDLVKVFGVDAFCEN